MKRSLFRFFYVIFLNLWIYCKAYLWKLAKAEIDGTREYQYRQSEMRKSFEQWFDATIILWLLSVTKFRKICCRKAIKRTLYFVFKLCFDTFCDKFRDVALMITIKLNWKCEGPKWKSKKKKLRTNEWQIEIWSRHSQREVDVVKDITQVDGTARSSDFKIILFSTGTLGYMTWKWKICIYHSKENYGVTYGSKIET